MYVLYVNGCEGINTKSFNKIKKLVCTLKECTSFSGEYLNINVTLDNVSIFIATGELVEYVYNESCNFYN